MLHWPTLSILRTLVRHRNSIANKFVEFYWHEISWVQPSKSENVPSSPTPSFTCATLYVLDNQTLHVTQVTQYEDWRQQLISPNWNPILSYVTTSDNLTQGFARTLCPISQRLKIVQSVTFLLLYSRKPNAIKTLRLALMMSFLISVRILEDTWL